MIYICVLRRELKPRNVRTCIHSYQQRQWKKVVELREPRAYATAVSMTDGSMWIMGGMGVEGSVFFAFF